MVEALVDLGSQPVAAIPKASATKAKTQTLPPEGPACTASANQAGPFVSKVFGKLYVTRATQQSYIQIDISGRKTLLVAMSAGAFPEHRQGILNLASGCVPRVPVSPRRVCSSVGLLWLLTISFFHPF